MLRQIVDHLRVLDRLLMRARLGDMAGDQRVQPIRDVRQGVDLHRGGSDQGAERCVARTGLSEGV